MTTPENTKMQDIFERLCTIHGLLDYLMNDVKAAIAEEEARILGLGMQGTAPLFDALAEAAASDPQPDITDEAWK